ncbi:hypothetical protein BpHYR1_003920 [Brachionus plicatilis]|uniref:Uncharacterized protein n=1 Tax=Brachionus plicatilis TaxID=10195 RepID=A0A3M7REV2_BRAPC|nr:hypothetical protein BpHYR1_003920 [Brachionus plicatilis]
MSTCISNCPDIYDCPWTIVREGYKTRILFSYQILKKLRIKYKLIRTVHAYAIRIIEKKAPTGVEVTDTLAVFSDHDPLYSSTSSLMKLFL